MHDPRVGRFFAVDPLASEFPHLTPYQFASNSPIVLKEIEGLQGEIYTLDLKQTSPVLKLKERKDFKWWPDAIEPDYKTVVVKGTDNSEVKYTFTYYGSTGAFHNGEFGDGPNILDWEKFKKNPLEALASGNYVSEDEIKASMVRDAALMILFHRVVKANTKSKIYEKPLQLQSMRDRLLGGISNKKLKSTIDKLWRPNAKVGSGSTGDAIRAEKQGTKFEGSSDHTQKAKEGLNTMRDLLKGNQGELNEKDRKAVFEVIDDLTRDTGLEWKGINYDYLNDKPLVPKK